MHTYGKVWGTTCPVFNKNNVEVHVIDILPDAFCSKHHHQHKFNMFKVLEGELWVQVWKDYDLVDITHLKAGESMVVAPGEEHQFFTRYSTCKALEVYWTEISESDIVRDGSGGRTPEKSTAYNPIVLTETSIPAWEGSDIISPRNTNDPFFYAIAT